MKRRILIIGAAGRDFHNFNVAYRGRSDTQVVAFTATQIPNIDGRRYPSELAGPGYPDGIPIVSEDDLEKTIRVNGVHEAVFSYSDISNDQVMAVGARVMAAGADFMLLGPDSTMLKARVPVVAVCAMRTGCGKSQTSRYVADILSERGLRVVVIRHPMPYGDLVRQAVQRFETLDDLDRHETSIEEREEYEPHIERGRIVFAGVDYAAIMERAEQEADVVVWDGGNNDLSFYRPDVHIVVLDPLRPNDIGRYHPGDTVIRTADLFVINKVDSASAEQVAAVRDAASELNSTAAFVEAESPPIPDDPDALRGKQVLVIEDGPTLTHGGMAFGAGTVAASRFGAAGLVDPRPFAVGSIRDTYRKYPTTGRVLPAMGYGAAQVAELEATIRATPADVVAVATPIDLRRVLSIEKPSVRIRYDLDELDDGAIARFLDPKIDSWKKEVDGVSG